MNFSEWEPVYEAILDDFGYDRSADEESRDELASLAAIFDLSRVTVDGQTVAIVGAGPSLPDELDQVREADRVFAASSAATILREEDIIVDCMVTDLDGTPETAHELTQEGTPVAVHAHGDNRDLVHAWMVVLERGNVLATTQAAPRGPVHNFGGFTDGDRAAFMADHLGADTLRFPGWDFDDPDLDREKRHKLSWAERLLAWLERRRGETFEILDGHRDTIEEVPTDTH